MKLNLRSSDVKHILQYENDLYYFTAVGFEVWDSDARVCKAYGDLATTTCGAVNSEGVFIGTSTTGVYFIPNSLLAGGGNLTGVLALRYSTSTTLVIPSNQINWMEGCGSALAIATSLSVTYIPSTLNQIKWSKMVVGSSKVALSPTRLGYIIAGSAYCTSLPSTDWDLADQVGSIMEPTFGSQTLTSQGVNTVIPWDGTLFAGDMKIIGGYTFVSFLSTYFSVNKNTVANIYRYGATGSGLLVTRNNLDTVEAQTDYFTSCSFSEAGYMCITAIAGNFMSIFKYDPILVQFNQIPKDASVLWDSQLLGSAWVGEYVVTFTTWGVVLHRVNGGTNYSRIMVLTMTSSSKLSIRSWGSFIVFSITDSSANNTINLLYVDQSAGTITLCSSVTITSRTGAGKSGYLSPVVDGLVVHTFSRHITVLSIDVTSRTLNWISSTTPVPDSLEGGYSHWWGAPALHPTKQYLIIGEGYGFHRANFWLFSLKNGIPLPLYSTDVDLPQVGSSAACSIGGFFVRPDLYLYWGSMSTGGFIVPHTFTYQVVATEILGQSQDIKFGADNCLFIATDNGIMVYDFSLHRYVSVTGVFGLSDNVKSIAVSGSADQESGLLAYGTSSGANTGQFGVLNMASKSSIAARVGDCSVAWAASTDKYAYHDELELSADSASSTRQLVLLGSSVKGIAKHGAYIYHFTESGMDVHRVSDGVRLCWASLANTTCGAVNDDGIYMGTSNGGVYKLPLANVASGLDQTAGLTQVLTAVTTPAIQHNSILGLAGHGLGLMVSTPAGIDFFTAGVRYKTTIPTQAKVAMDSNRIAYGVLGTVYYGAWPTADWAYGSLTNNVIASITVRSVKFGADLFVAHSGGVTVVNTGSGSLREITSELGSSRNVIAIQPTTGASQSVGLLAYSIDVPGGQGLFGVLDMTNAI